MLGTGENSTHQPDRAARVIILGLRLEDCQVISNFHRLKVSDSVEYSCRTGPRLPASRSPLSPSPPPPPLLPRPFCMTHPGGFPQKALIHKHWCGPTTSFSLGILKKRNYEEANKKKMRRKRRGKGRGVCEAMRERMSSNKRNVECFYGVI